MSTTKVITKTSKSKTSEPKSKTKIDVSDVDVSDTEIDDIKDDMQKKEKIIRMKMKKPMSDVVPLPVTVAVPVLAKKTARDIRDDAYNQCIEIIFDAYKSMGPSDSVLEKVTKELGLRRPKSKKPKDRKDLNKPKAASTSFFVYGLEMRKAQNIADPTSKLSNKFLSEKWKSMSTEEKKPYLDIADIDKKRYESDMEVFYKKYPDQVKTKAKNPFNVPLGVIDQNDPNKISNGKRFVKLDGAAGKKVQASVGNISGPGDKNDPDISEVEVNENDEDSTDSSDSD